MAKGGSGRREEVTGWRGARIGGGGGGTGKVGWGTEEGGG